MEFVIEGRVCPGLTKKRRPFLRVFPVEIDKPSGYWIFMALEVRDGPGRSWKNSAKKSYVFHCVNVEYKTNLHKVVIFHWLLSCAQLERVDNPASHWSDNGIRSWNCGDFSKNLKTSSLYLIKDDVGENYKIIKQRLIRLSFSKKIMIVSTKICIRNLGYRTGFRMHGFPIDSRTKSCRSAIKIMH